MSDYRDGRLGQPPFGVVMKSKPYTFKVGKNRTEFYVHQEALKDLSEVFKFTMTGPMKEGVEGVAELEDVTEAGFTRLCEFVYTGDYSNPQPELVQAPESSSNGKSNKRKAAGAGPASAAKKSRSNNSNPSAASVTATTTAAVDTNATTATAAATTETPNAASSSPSSPVLPLGEAATPKSSSKKAEPESALYSIYGACRAFENHKKASKKGQGNQGKENIKQAPISKAKYQRLQKFLHWNFHWEEPHQSNLRWDDPRSQRDAKNNNNPRESWAPVFLGHAEMYFIGDKYDLQRLRDASKAKLHKALKFWAIYPSRVGDFTQLVRFIYDNTVERDKAREMIYAFAGCIMEDVCEFPEFQEILECAPEFSRRMLQIASSNMKSLEKSAEH